MICPNCGYDNLPGDESCKHCEMDLTQLDRPTGQTLIERRLLEDPVAVLHPRQAVVVKVDDSVGMAVAKMLEGNLGALLVVDKEGTLQGIFSERDLLTRVAGVHANWENMPIREVMTPKPEAVASTDKIAFALQKMDVGGYRHLPIVDSGKPQGVISVRDMLRYITRLC
jgi:CBS domain-containing protein